MKNESDELQKVRLQTPRSALTTTDEKTNPRTLTKGISQKPQISSTYKIVTKKIKNLT